ncbi:MAG: glycosyltransferase [Thermoplasmata archaeon]
MVNISHNMIKNSAIITTSSIKTGLGIYAWRLYNMHLLEHLRYYEIDPHNTDYDAKYVIQRKYKILNRWFFNKKLSYYFGSVYKKDIEKYSVVHLGDQSIFYLSKYNKNSIGTVQDLFGIEEKNKYYNWNLKNLQYIEKLKAVVVPTDNIKKKVMEMYSNVNIVRIHYWTENDFMLRDKIESRKKLGLDLNKIILLNVSIDIPRKNIDILPKIMNSLDENYILLRIGDTDRIINEFQRKSQIKVVSKVPKELYPLYFNAADFLLFPSLDEGFGFPIIEAIKSGLPVIASNREYAKEVLQGKGILADPLNYNEWVEAINKNLDNLPAISKNALSLYDYYSEGRAKKEYEKLYHSLGY